MNTRRVPRSPRDDEQAVAEWQSAGESRYRRVPAGRRPAALTIRRLASTMRESRYGPARLHPRCSSLRNASQKNTKAGDHHDQYLDAGAHHPNVSGGRTR